MITILENDFVRNKKAVSEYTLKIFGIPIYRRIQTSTNGSIIKQLTPIEIKKVTGFSDEDND